MTFADILAPIAPERFFADYHGRQILHVPGAADKFAEVMSWAKLNELLNLSAIWTSKSFELSLDGAFVPAREYCQPGLDHGTGATVLRPDPARVTALFKDGASVLLNDVDTLNPGLAAVARALEETLESRVQANLYCSSRERQAFPTHFDAHDVYAVHVAGEKLWRIYEGRHDNPVEHPSFKGQPAAYHEKARGRVVAEVLLKPGDLLYIPRGTYHDAIARTAGTIHVAFGAVAVIGLDLVSQLFERAVGEPAFRRDLPRRHTPGGEAAFDRHLRGLAERLAALAGDSQTAAAFRAFQDRYRYPRGGFALSDKMLGAGGYRLNGDGFAVVRRGDAWALRRAKHATAIPAGMEGPVRWIVERGQFAGDDFAAAFAGLGAERRDDVLRALQAMGVIVRT